MIGHALQLQLNITCKPSTSSLKRVASTAYDAAVKHWLCYKVTRSGRQHSTAPVAEASHAFPPYQTPWRSCARLQCQHAYTRQQVPATTDCVRLYGQSRCASLQLLGRPPLRHARWSSRPLPSQRTSARHTRVRCLSSRHGCMTARTHPLPVGRCQRMFVPQRPPILPPGSSQSRTSKQTHASPVHPCIVLNVLTVPAAAGRFLRPCSRWLHRWESCRARPRCGRPSVPASCPACMERSS